MYYVKLCKKQNEKLLKIYNQGQINTKTYEDKRQLIMSGENMFLNMYMYSNWKRQYRKII